MIQPAIKRDDLLRQDAALHPAWPYDHPSEVVKDPTLTNAEKRAVLSSWASDACALHSAPGLRQPPGASRAVSFDEIIEALQSLDDSPPWPGGAGRRRLVWPFGPNQSMRAR